MAQNLIRNVLRYRKPTTLLVGIAAVLSIALAVFFLANPPKEKEGADTPDTAAVEEAKQDPATPAETESDVQAEAATPIYANNTSGISYERPVKAHLAEDMEQVTGMTRDKVLAEYFVLSGTETADIADSAGDETIEIYTGNIGDGDSGVVLFKNAAGTVLGTEDAHAARAGWNNVYIGKVDGTGFILTVGIEDRDDYGEYRYQVFRFGAAGEIMQIAGSAFAWGQNYEYDDEQFHKWADQLSYYLENSHLILSSQDGEIRTDRISEADRYNYETLRRAP